MPDTLAAGDGNETRKTKLEKRNSKNETRKTKLEIRFTQKFNEFRVSCLEFRVSASELFKDDDVTRGGPGDSGWISEITRACGRIFAFCSVRSRCARRIGGRVRESRLNGRTCLCSHACGPNLPRRPGAARRPLDCDGLRPRPVR